MTKQEVLKTLIVTKEFENLFTGNAQNDTADDGFLRLSAGGGTSVNSQSSIDISGFSTVADMSNNIVMRTAGTERLRIDNSGNVNVTVGYMLLIHKVM